MKRITITLPEEEEQRLRSEAARRRLSISEVVRRKLERSDTCVCDDRALRFIGIAKANPPFDRMSHEELERKMVDDLMDELNP